MSRASQIAGLCVIGVGFLIPVKHVAAQENATCRWVPNVGWRCPAPQAATTARKAARPQTPAKEIVRVIVTHSDGSGTEDRGSGVLVDGPDKQHGWVLTAEHVTRERREATVVFPSGRQFRATVVASDRADDVALLRIAKPLTAPRRIAEDAPGLGAEVYLAGYPAGGTYYSWVTRRTKLYESNDRVEVAGHAENGTSGGPMIDARGRVVSVISTTQRAGLQPWTTSGCSTARLRQFLKPKPRLVPIQKPTKRPPTTPEHTEIDYERLASLVASKIPKPPRGEQGERGESGRPGPAGPPGKDADPKEIAKLHRRVNELERAIQALGKSVPAYFEIVPRGK